MPIQQPPGGSEVLTCPSAVGPARGPNDRQEGGPTGTTALPGGSGGGGGRGGRWRLGHYILHLRESNPREAELSVEKASAGGFR
jgi:hypothetical protein